MRAALAWLRRHRRRLIAIALLIAFFYFLGYITPRVNNPLMCKIYG
jgi:CHASE2 domain-containing sensor protein